MPTPKVVKKKVWCVRIPLVEVAHCLCHNGGKMLMVSESREDAESFAKALEKMEGVKVLPATLTYKR